MDIRKVALACMVVMASAGAAADEDAASERNDPLETLNRFTTGFNSILRGAVLDPVVDFYQFITPDDIQGAVSNAA